MAFARDYQARAPSFSRTHTAERPLQSLAPTGGQRPWAGLAKDVKFAGLLEDFIAGGTVRLPVKAEADLCLSNLQPFQG